MALVNKYVLYIERVEKVVAGNVHISPLDTIEAEFGPDVQIYDFGAHFDLTDGQKTGVGFGSKYVYHPDNLIPHKLVLLQIDDSSPGYTSVPGVSRNAIDDAIHYGFSGFGEEISPTQALEFVQSIHHDGDVYEDEFVRIEYGAPYLDDDGIIKRDATVTTSSSE